MTDTYTTTFERRVHEKDEHGARIDRRFGAFDTKGREFGAMVRPFTCEFEHYTAELLDNEYNHRRDGTRTQREPGRRYFGFSQHATRGGECYGALQRDKIFASEAERDAAITKYFATAERGALKNKARAR